MSEFFAVIEQLGELRIEKVYAYYEEPLLFLCNTKPETYYLFLRLESDTQEWIAVRISENRLRELEKNIIELREVFTKPEEGILFKVDNNGGKLLSALLRPEDLTDEMLPFEGEYLDYKENVIFGIDGNDICMEQVLSEENDVPVFFVCRRGEDRYLCLKTDALPMKHFITKVSWLHILAMLEGDQSMRDAFLSGSKYWIAESDGNAENGVIREINRDQIPEDVLPTDHTAYKVCTDEIRRYMGSLSDKIYKSKAWIAFVSRLSQALSEGDKEKLVGSLRYLLIIQVNSISLGTQLNQHSSSVQQMNSDEMSLLAA